MNERARPETVAEPPVLLSVEAGVARLTMNRPRQYNAISRGMLDAMLSALEGIARDRAIRAVVVAGNGPAFSGGHDLKEMMACRTEEFIGGLFDACSRVMLAMAALPQPVVARVHGTATAAGCQLVAACDLAVATSDARFATSGINFGLFCATPGVPLSRNVARSARSRCCSPASSSTPRPRWTGASSIVSRRPIGSTRNSRSSSRP